MAGDNNLEKLSKIKGLAESLSGLDSNGREQGCGLPVIKVLGVGGGGCNAVNRMYREQVPGVEYGVINTDHQHLIHTMVSTKLGIGPRLSRGLGVGGDPAKGRRAAEESREEISKLIQGTDMVFIAAGMGGGTGTGAAPVVAEVAKDSGALTVAVVTKPFSFESRRRRQQAERGIESLREKVDTLITIPNDRLLSMYNIKENPTWEEALELADTVLQQGIQAIAEVVTVPGDINLDFADVRSVMEGAGPAWMALGTGCGEDRAVQAAEMALKSPLLDVSLEKADRILLVVTGGPTMSLKEVEQAASVIEDIADDDANVFFGTVKDMNMDDELRITLVATGFPIQEASLDRGEGLTTNALASAASKPRPKKHSDPPISGSRAKPKQRSRKSGDGGVPSDDGTGTAPLRDWEELQEVQDTDSHDKTEQPLDLDSEIYRGIVKLQLGPDQPLPRLIRFVDALRGHSKLQLVKLAGDNYGAVKIHLKLRAPLPLMEVLLQMKDVSQVNVSNGLDRGDQEPVLNVRLAGAPLLI